MHDLRAHGTFLFQGAVPQKPRPFVGIWVDSGKSSLSDCIAISLWNIIFIQLSSASRFWSSRVRAATNLPSMSSGLPPHPGLPRAPRSSTYDSLHPHERGGSRVCGTRHTVLQQRPSKGHSSSGKPRRVDGSVARPARPSPPRASRSLIPNKRSMIFLRDQPEGTDELVIGGAEVALRRPASVKQLAISKFLHLSFLASCAAAFNAARPAPVALLISACDLR
jgi:hypothetical protein